MLIKDTGDLNKWRSVLCSCSGRLNKVKMSILLEIDICVCVCVYIYIHTYIHAGLYDIIKISARFFLEDKTKLF